MSTTPEELAERKRELRRRRMAEAGLTDAAGSARIPKRPQQDRAPLSFAQLRMWFLQQLDPASPAYNVCIAFRLDGELDADALGTAFRGLINRHEILRTRYEPTADGTPVQVIDPVSPVTMRVTDLRELPADMAERRTEELAREDSAGPFDLAAEHPIRVRLLRLGERRSSLVLTVHHIAWDGGTFHALCADLSELYRAALHGRAVTLEPLPVQYADVAAWQPDRYSDEALAEHFEYWRGQLTPLPDGLALPTDAPRRANSSERGERTHRSLAPEVTEAITAFGQRMGATPFMVLFAGFAALLARYTGARDVPIGSATMNRDAAELERLIGNFGNTLVLRADLSGDPGFAQLTEQVRRICTEGYDHQDLPFDKLVERLRPPRTPGRSVFFDVMLLFLTQGLSGPDLPGVAARWETVHNDTTQFDLALEAFHTGGLLRIETTYRSELFERETIDALLEHLETLIAAGIAEPDRRVGTLDVLTAAERERILRKWNDTAVPEPHRTLLELFETQVAATPWDTAVESGELSLSYGELNARANRLARHLRTVGVGPESRVGVHLERSVEMVVGMLAIQKAGGAFVPVEPSWPDRRTAAVCADAGLAAVLSDAGSTGAFAGVAVVDMADPAIARYGTDDLGIAVPPEGLAYVIYTSGSTGTPKGAMIRHRAIAHRLVWQKGVLDFGGQRDASLFKAPLGFDISVNELFLPLVTGARLVIAEPGGERDIEYLAGLLARHRVTFVYLVSSMLDLLLEQDGFTEQARTLRHVWCGGEVLTPELFHRFRAKSAAVLYHGYGPAEATIGVSHVVYRFGAIRSTVSIGRPNTNTRLYVLDRCLQPVPVGVPGELYAGGVYLGRGYLGDPGRTAERFVADPFGAAGERMYRTGDLARWRPDGTLDFLGRADNQVKIRGMRVELEEIEAVLAEHHRIRSAVASVREDAPGVKRLVGYVLPHDPPGSEPDLVREVEGWLAQRLPEHMVPSALVALTGFPLMPSGKVDRARLPAPEAGSSEPSRAPATRREQLLCELFGELLGVSGVGVDDDFFRLGGDSIISVQLVSRVRRAGTVITPRQVFEHPTPAGLAAVATGESSGTGEAADAALGEAPLTPVMRWAAGPDGGWPGLNQSVLLVLPAGLSEDTLVATLQAALDRHDVLRARLDPDGERLVVPPPGTVPARDLLSRRAEPAEGDTLATAAADARASLDPRAGRMLAAVRFPGRNGPGRLLLVAHHLVVDWVSWWVLLDDLAEAWRQAEAGGTPRLRRRGTSFRRWTRLLGEQARAEDRIAELPLWQRILDGGDPDGGVFERPLDPHRDVTATLRTAELEIPPERAEPLLGGGPAAYHAGVHEVLLSALAVAFAAVRGRRAGTQRPDADALLLGMEGHGREEQLADGVDLSAAVGWFTTFYPVRLDPGDVAPAEVAAGGPAAGTLLKRVKEQLREIPDHGIGYGLLRHLNPETAAKLAALPEPRIAFNYLGRFTAPDGQPWGLAPEAAMFRLPAEARRSVPVGLDIEAAAVEQADGIGLRVALAWPETVLSAELVGELLAEWQAMLDGLAGHLASDEAGGFTPSDLPLVSLTQQDIDELEDLPDEIEPDDTAQRRSG